MQIKFYGKTYSFNTKDELGRVLDDIYYQYQDLRKDIPRKYEEKASKELDKLEREFQETYRKARNMGDELKNSKEDDMNYYAELAREKRNDNLFLKHLRTKSFRSADELEKAIKSYVAGGRVISDDADGFTVEAIDDDGKHTYKIYLREDGGTSERVTVEKVVKLNSKEKSNSVVTRGTIHGHRYEVERVDYLGQATYIGYVYDKEGNTILKTNIYMKAGACEQEIKSKVFNSKENSMNYYEKIIQEKKNDSQVIERGTVKGVKYFIEKITGYKRSVYRGNLEKDGRVVTSTWTCDTIDECKREINKLRDTDALLNNSKEEKDNGRIEEMYREIQELKKKGLSSIDIDKYYAAINYRKTAEQYLAEYKKTKNTDYKYAAEGQLRKAEQLEREYKKHLHNSKEGKENANFNIVRKFYYKECLVSVTKLDSGKYSYIIEKDGREEGSDKSFSTQSSAETDAKKEVEAVWNEKEEGYYAKLAEEKEAKRNALEPVKRAEQLAREGKQYAEIVEAIKKEYNLPADKAARAADQGKRNYELNPINGEHKKPARI